MNKFIELHRSDDEEIPILLNVNQIAYIHNVENEAIVYLSIGNNDKAIQVIHVKETYEEIRNMIIGI